MYTFDDRNGDSLTLRPEGTAACVRAVLEHGLTGGGQPQKLWYIGPMFRHERPQKGRYRQFHQIGLRSIQPRRSGHRCRADRDDVAVMGHAWHS